MSRLLVWILAVSMIAPLTAVASETPNPSRIDEEALEGDGVRSVIVSTVRAVDSGLEERLNEHGQVLSSYSVIDGAHVLATPDQARDIASMDAVEAVHADEPLETHLGTSRPATGVNEKVWEATKRGSNVTVAVVDTGIDQSHPSVDDRVETSVTFTGGGDSQETPAGTDEDGHGTHVGGIVAGTGDSSKLLDSGNQRYAGMAPGAGLVALDISASFSTSTAIDAFDWVHQNHEQYGIQVVQNSWGRKETGQAYDPDDPAIEASNALVAEDDIAVVFSAANEGPEPQTLAMEAMNPNVLSVAAVDDNGNVAEFSSRGPVMLENGSKAPWVKPGVSAPGVRIKSAAAGQTSDTYHEMSGTSQAAPHVSGLVAMLRTQFPSLTAPEVHEIIRRSARDIGEPGPDPATGHGFISAQAALRQASQASNGTLFTTSETYTAQGTLTPSSPADGLLPDDTGAESGSVEGTIPVKPKAKSLEFRAEWSPAQDGLQSPDIEVVLEDPSGTELIVPSEDNSAERTIVEPARGTWGWTMTASGQGAADYSINGTVTSERSLSVPANTGGGLFDTGTGQDVQRLFEQSVDQYGLGPVLGVIAAGVLVLVGLTRAIF